MDFQPILGQGWRWPFKATSPLLRRGWSAGALLPAPRQPHRAFRRLRRLACTRAQVSACRPAHAVAPALMVFDDNCDGNWTLADPLVPPEDRRSSSQVRPPRPRDDRLACPHHPYEADPLQTCLHFARSKSLLCARWAPATTTSRSRSSRRAPRDLEHFDFVQVGSFPISSLPDAELSAAQVWQDSSVPGCAKRLLAATRCPHLSPALHQPSPESPNDFLMLCVWRRQVWQHEST